MAKKNVRFAGICVYCGAAGVTKQHVIPNWVRNVVPRVGSSHTQRMFFNHRNFSTKTLTIHPDALTRQGAWESRKVMNVCGTCNGGWMSVLEEQARPALTAMMQGNPVTLSGEVQRIVFRWVAMTSVSAEYTDKRSIAIPQSDRQMLFDSGCPPNWRIWLGKYEGDQVRYKHKGFATWDQVSPHPANCNMQASTFGLGKLFVYAVSSTVIAPAEFDPGVPDAMLELQLEGVAPLQWPPPRWIDDPEADQIAETLSRRFPGGSASLLVQ